MFVVDTFMVLKRKKAIVGDILPLVGFLEASPLTSYTYGVCF